MMILCLPLSGQGQKNKGPRNLKDAVLQLDQVVSDSLRELIRETDDDEIKKISYPWGGGFRTVFDWAMKKDEPSRIRKYLIKRGVSVHQEEVILLAFKNYQLTGSFEENEILLPFQKTEAKWAKEDAIRFSADSLRGRYIPKDLNDCFNQIDGLWNDSVKVKVANWTEDEFTTKAHFGFGLSIRNNWRLWAGSRLSKFFNKKGVAHPDDMSGIILSSYHRYLNKEAINLDEQLDHYKQYWEKAEKEQLEREQEKLENARSYFTELTIGDTLEYNYNYGFSTESQEGKWMDDTCLARGILVEKKRETLQVKVKVIQACNRKGVVYFSNEDLRYYDEKTNRLIPPKKIKKEYAKKGSVKWYELDDWEL